MSESLLKIRAAGFSLDLENGELFVEPYSQLTPVQLGFLSAHRREIIEALNREQAAELIKTADDGLRFCRECRHLINGRCFTHKFRPVDDIPRRCAEFLPQVTA